MPSIEFHVSRSRSPLARRIHMLLDFPCGDPAYGDLHSIWRKYTHRVEIAGLIGVLASSPPDYRAVWDAIRHIWDDEWFWRRMKDAKNRGVKKRDRARE